MLRLTDRRLAGQYLAESLARYGGREDVVVLGLPRGGVLVAAEVARELHAPLEVFTVRKLGVPWNRELAVGAIASGGVRVLDEGLMRQLGISVADMTPIVESETRELARRESLYRPNRAGLEFRGKTVIVVDDGLATGATMAAAVEALRKLHPWKIVVAVPISSDNACEALVRRADECVCLATPTPFHGVGHWYEDFHDVSDDEVLAALAGSQAAPQSA